MAQHAITIDRNDADRARWECSCGAAGSCPEDRAEEHAEKHIPAGEPMVYRYPARRRPLS